MRVTAHLILARSLNYPPVPRITNNEQSDPVCCDLLFQTAEAGENSQVRAGFCACQSGRHRPGLRNVLS